MAKTNSRVKKPATSTSASTGKSTFKPLPVSSTKLTNSKPPAQKLSKTAGNIIKGQGYKAPVRPTTTASKPAPKPAAKKPVKPVASKPVTTVTTPRTRGGVSKGGSNGTTGKYEKKLNTTAALKARADARIAAEKAEKGVDTKAPKADLKRTPRMSAVERRKLAGKAPAERSKTLRNVKIAEKAKALKAAKLAKAGKVGAGVAIGAGLIYGASKLAGSSKKPDSGKKPEKTKTLIETPSLKDELKKRGVDTKPVKDKAKTNWLDTAKPGDTLKYVPDNKKSKKDDSKKGSLPKAIDKAVRAADGNQPGSGYSLKFTGDRSKVAGKDKWGRSPSDKWYGFNPEKKKYEAPTMVKADTKKADTKPVVKTTPKTTTPKASTPAVKKAEPVGTLAPKPTAPIATKSLEEAKTIVPSKSTTETTASTTSSTSSNGSTSPSATGAQPRASFMNKVRGVVNASRERRAGRAASRGNEDRAEKLQDKISATEKKMMMRKGGVVKTKSKSKKK